MKELFEVEVSSQVLKNGTWGSIDCEWDWEHDYYYFSIDEEEKAMEFFKSVELSLDSPTVRIYHIWENKYGQTEDEELLDERWVGEENWV